VGFNCAMVLSLETTWRRGEPEGVGSGDERNASQGGLASPGAGEQSSCAQTGNWTAASVTGGG
jgi:hypothetical protein